MGRMQWTVTNPVIAFQKEHGGEGGQSVLIYQGGRVPRANTLLIQGIDFLEQVNRGPQDVELLGRIRYSLYILISDHLSYQDNLIPFALTPNWPHSLFENDQLLREPES